MSYRTAVSMVSATALAMSMISHTPVSANARPVAAVAPAPPSSLVAEPAPCRSEALQQLVGAAGQIGSVELVNDGVDVCRVKGVVQTSGDGAPPGSARFELNLPVNWNGRFLFLGGGGFDGNVPTAPSAQLAKGYVTLATDSGHVESPLYPPNGLDATWAVTASGEPDDAKITDFAYRSRNQVNAHLRPVVSAFYGGGAIRHAYFIGCSGGGREALIEAQRYPDDYDGFIAGNPTVSPGTPLLAARNFRVLTQAPIPYAKFAEIDRAVMADCDEKDGVIDGLVQNPALCAFDPRRLVQSGVLTVAQADALATYLSAPTDTEGRRVGYGSSVTGMGDLSGVFPGMIGGLSGLSVYLSDDMPAESGIWPWGPMPYGTVNWLLFNGAISSLSLARTDLSILDPSVSTPEGVIHSDVARKVETALRPTGVHPEEMGDFFRSGSKLIIYHGFNDTILDPYPMIETYAGIVQTAGGLDRAQQSARLFMAPGMGHCAGGTGPNAFDPLAAMEAWVEQGVAPDAILAVKFKDNMPGGPIDRSMPLCPFPQMARFDGVGRIEDATSWTCSAEDHRMLEVGPNGTAAGAGPLLQAFPRSTRQEP